MNTHSTTRRLLCALFATALLETAAFAAGHAIYNIPDAPKEGLEAMDFPIEVREYPKGFKDGYFFAYQYELKQKVENAEGKAGFNGFYLGIQYHKEGNSAHCSYFGKGAHLVGGTARGGADGMKGWTGRIDYPWKVGVKYTLHVEKVGKDKYKDIGKDEAGWEGSILDDKGKKTIITVYAVAKELGNLKPRHNFWVERFKNKAELPNVEVSFGAPIGYAKGRKYHAIIPKTDEPALNQVWTLHGSPATEAVIKSGPNVQ